MDALSVGAMSIAMHQSQLQQAVNLSVMKKVMNLQETEAAALIENLQEALPPSSGHQLDILA